MTRPRLRDLRPQLRHHLGELLRSAGDAIKALADDLFGHGRHPVEQLLADQIGRVEERLDRLEHTGEWVPSATCFGDDCTSCVDHTAPCPCPRCRSRTAYKLGAESGPCYSCERRGCLAPDPEDE